MRRGKEIDFLLLTRAKARAAVLASYPTDTASGSPANFPDGADGVPVKSLTVNILAVQAGSGDPSPDNLRAISGRTGLTLYHSGEDTTDYDELAVSWENDAGAIYGGTLNVTSGLLTVDRVLATLTDEMSWSTYSSSGTQKGFLLSAANAGIEDAMAGTSSATAPYVLCSLIPVGTSTWTRGRCGMQNQNLWFGFTSEDFDGVDAFKAYVGEHPIQMVVPVATPVTYQLPPHQVRTLLGENNLWSDAGEVTVEYRADLDLYIEKRLGEGGEET